MKPLPRKELNELKKYFKGLNVVSVYDVVKKKVSPINIDATLRRRPKY